MDTETHTLTRRRFLHYTGALGVLAGLQGIVPAYAWQGTAAEASDAPRQGAHSIDLLIRKQPFNIGARQGTAVTINGSVPGPLLRLREGETVTIGVTNQLEEVTSIHWHGVLVPPDMDGVPGVSFPGIKPGETFTYRYPVKQSGTYWYHSPSGLQEQAGHYGPLIIDPAEPDPFAYDREYVAMLSDWTFEDPHDVLMKLKKQSDYYNFQQRTIGDFFRDVSEKGWRATISDRLMWGRMRMDPTDILDVTGYTSALATTSFTSVGSEAECATKPIDGMDGKSQCLYEAGTEPLGRSVRWMQTGGERAAPERYWCGAMQAAKMPGLAEGLQGESTK